MTAQASSFVEREREGATTSTKIRGALVLVDFVANKSPYFHSTTA